MSPAGDLRHHPAEARMQRHLAEDAIGEDAVAIFDDGDTGLIAGSFDSEDFHIGDARPLREASVTCQHRSTAAKEQAQAGSPVRYLFPAAMRIWGGIDKACRLWLNDASHLADFSAKKNRYQVRG